MNPNTICSEMHREDFLNKLLLTNSCLYLAKCSTFYNQQIKISADLNVRMMKK